MTHLNKVKRIYSIATGISFLLGIGISSQNAVAKSSRYPSDQEVKSIQATFKKPPIQI
jgi:hypothetical protein